MALEESIREVLEAQIAFHLAKPGILKYDERLMQELILIWQVHKRNPGFNPYLSFIATGQLNELPELKEKGMLTPICGGDYSCKYPLSALIKMYDCFEEFKLHLPRFGISPLLLIP